VLLKIPIHTIAQGMQLVLFFIRELFTIKQGVGISRKHKTQELTFVYKKQSI